MVRVLLRVDNVSQRKFFEILRSATFDFFTRSNGDFLKVLETFNRNVATSGMFRLGINVPAVAGHRRLDDVT